MLLYEKKQQTLVWMNGYTVNLLDILLIYTCTFFSANASIGICFHVFLFPCRERPLSVFGKEKYWARNTCSSLPASAAAYRPLISCWHGNQANPWCCTRYPERSKIRSFSASVTAHYTYYTQTYKQVKRNWSKPSSAIKESGKRFNSRSIRLKTVRIEVFFHCFIAN